MVKTTFCSHFFVLLQSAYLKTAEIDQSDDENIFHIICLFSLFLLSIPVSGERQFEIRYALRRCRTTTDDPLRRAFGDGRKPLRV